MDTTCNPKPIGTSAGGPTPEPTDSGRRKARCRRIGCTLTAMVAAYGLLYACRFVQVNRVEDRTYVMASALPVECRAGVDLCGEPPETVGVWLLRTDIDGDGKPEWITDAGDCGRGAGNSWYNIWKERKDGSFIGIGEFYCDVYWAVPRPWIFGHPSLLCVESRGFTEWVAWQNGRYTGHDEIGQRPLPRQ